MGQMSSKMTFSPFLKTFSNFLFSFFFLHKGRGPLTLESKYFVSVFVKNIQNWVKAAKIAKNCPHVAFSKSV